MASKFIPIALAACVGLTACSSSVPLPLLPTAAAKKKFTYTRTVLRLGVDSFGNATSEVPPSLTEQVYTLECLDDGGTSADSRYNQAISTIEQTEPLVYAPHSGDSTQKSTLSRSVNSHIVQPTGCQVETVDLNITTTEPRQILDWTADHHIRAQSLGLDPETFAAR